MPTLPKQDRPAREGARVASVETGLAAAAAKLAQQVSVEKKKTFYCFCDHFSCKSEQYGGKNTPTLENVLFPMLFLM